MISLRIIGKISQELKSKIVDGKEINNDNTIGFFVDYSESDISLNHKFDKIIYDNEIEKIDFKLIYITNETFIPFETVETGYKTICFFEFFSKSKLVNQIQICDNWYDSTILKTALFS